MATIRKRGSKWEAQVRRKDCPSFSKSFLTRADAQAWARKRERELDQYEAGTGELPGQPKPHEGLVVRDLLIRYRDSVTPSKRGARSEGYRIDRFLGRKLAATKIDELSSASVASYRDERLKEVSGPTVRRELSTLRHIFELARKDWGFPISPNPVGEIAIPADSKPRTRRLEPDEAKRLAKALEASSLPYLKPIVLLAIETGMRRGELLSLTWANIDFQGRTAHLPVTKNGHARTVPLTPRAVLILTTLKADQAAVIGTAPVFTVKANALRLSWDRLRTKAKLVDLHLHDLRHEAVSRFFEMGLSTPEVAAISGHRDYRMLSRYTHLRPADIAKKLALLRPSTDELDFS